MVFRLSLTVILSIVISFVYVAYSCAETGDNELVFVKDNDKNDDNSLYNKVDHIKISDEVFVPTSEWQIVKNNQAIPPGLHVRMNIQTGLKEAKLLDENDPSSKKDPKEKMKNFIEKLNDHKNDGLDPKERVGKQMDQLKKKFKETNLHVNSDTEIIKKSISNMKSSNDKKELLKILDDLEFVVHKYDNGLVFSDLGGFEMVMNRLNSTHDSDLKMKLALVLGSSLQSNFYVQKHALDSNLLQLILNQITISTHSANQDKVLAKFIFVLSGFLRNYPSAQNHFIQHNGIETLVKVLENHSYCIKIKVKVLTLINDLIIERNEASKHLKDGNKEQVRKYHEYLKFDLVNKIIQTDLCKQFEPALINATDSDSHEKIYDAILSLINECKKSFTPALKNLLKKLKNESTSNAVESNEQKENGYFYGLGKKIDRILSYEL